MKIKHYSIRTVKSYLGWIKRFIIFHDKKHPKDMGGEEIKAFLDYLVLKRHVSSSTQNQALQGILFLYKNVIKKEIGWIKDIARSSKIKHLPVVKYENAECERSGQVELLVIPLSIIYLLSINYALGVYEVSDQIKTNGLHFLLSIMFQI